MSPPIRRHGGQLVLLGDEMSAKLDFVYHLIMNIAQEDGGKMRDILCNLSARFIEGCDFGGQDRTDEAIADMARLTKTLVLMQREMDLAEQQRAEGATIQ